MTYKKHSWIKGEKITSALLNNIENGIEEALTKISKIQAEMNEKEIEAKTIKK